MQKLSSALLCTVALTILACSGKLLASQDHDETEFKCPLWMTSDGTKCICPDYSGLSRAVLFCDYKTATTYVSSGVCIGIWENNGSGREAVMGNCPYVPYKKMSYAYKLYTPLPNNDSEDALNVMCSPFNREGFLCSSCRPGYGVSVYSFGLSCAKCDGNPGALWYIVLELVPITLFYVIVVVFSIRVTLAPMAGFIFFSHSCVMVVREKVALYTSLAFSTNKFIHATLQAFLLLGGIWNLDFFRFVVPPFCISENIQTMHAVVLEYVSAFYPIVLIVVTFLVVQLQSHNGCVTWLCIPVQKWFARFRRTWDIKRSIMDALSTFLLLSYSKILFVSFKLLHLTSVQNLHGKVVSQSLRFDPNIKYFGPQHLPYALISIFAIAVFTIFPIFLLVSYPTRLFQYCLQRCNSRATLILRMFVDTYHGCLKDGTNGTRDYRAVSAVYLVLRVSILYLYVRQTEESSNGLTLIIYGILFYLISLLLAVFKPYKADYMNYCESALLFLLGCAALVLFLWFFYPSHSNHVATLLALICLVPQLCLVGYIVFVIIRGKKIVTWVQRKIKRGVNSFEGTMRIPLRSLTVSLLADGIQQQEEVLPDRFVNPNDYLDSVSTSYQLEGESACNDQ